MDLQFTPEEQAFRQEVRAFITAALPDDIRHKMLEGRARRSRTSSPGSGSSRKGWACRTGRVEYGGTGWNPIQQYIFTEEIQPRRLRSPLHFGV